MAGRQVHEHVLAADIFVNFHENLFVGEAADARVGQGNLDIVGDGGRERLVGIAGHELHGQTPKSKWRDIRSEEHTSELQSLMRISYAVFCLKKKKKP